MHVNAITNGMSRQWITESLPSQEECRRFMPDIHRKFSGETPLLIRVWAEFEVIK
jgi:hypothetical protein